MREETNADVFLRNTPRAARDGDEPNQTRMSRDLFPREVLREPGFSAEIRRVDAWPFYHVIQMWSSVFASQEYLLVAFVPQADSCTTAKTGGRRARPAPG